MISKLQRLRIFLNYLEAGGTYEHNGYTICLYEGDLCYECQFSEGLNDPEYNIYLPVNFSVNDIMNILSKKSEDEIAKMSMDNAFNNYRKTQKKERNNV